MNTLCIQCSLWYCALSSPWFYVCCGGLCILLLMFRLSMQFFTFCICFFFFQAEDGIRDSSVTGVQTCALPISWPLAPGDVDAFLQWRTSHVARATRKWVAYHLRSFLRHLYREGLMGRDLAPAVSGGRVYQGERAPVPLTEEEITRVVSQAKRERAHQPAGRRDYATLSLLATYGMRASEIVHLRLEDIDWRHERIRVRHAKRGAVSDVPLLPAVGEAVLDYLRHGRPTTSRREAFVRSRAPYETPLRADALYQAA